LLAGWCASAVPALSWPGVRVGLPHAARIAARAALNDGVDLIARASGPAGVLEPESAAALVVGPERVHLLALVGLAATG